MYSEGLVLKTMYAFMCRTFNPHYFFVTSQLHETLSKLYSQSSIILLLKATLCFLQVHYHSFIIISLYLFISCAETLLQLYLYHFQYLNHPVTVYS